MFDILEAKYLKEYKIEFLFSDNLRAIVDLEYCIHKPGLFKSLKDINYFKSFELDFDLNTIKWSNGLDIAPDTLYSIASQNAN